MDGLCIIILYSLTDTSERFKPPTFHWAGLTHGAPPPPPASRERVASSIQTFHNKPALMFYSSNEMAYEKSPSPRSAHSNTSAGRQPTYWPVPPRPD